MEERKCSETGCSGNCSSCSKAHDHQPQSLLFPQNDLSNVKKVIGVASGKGGVGKSLVTAMLANLMQQKGYKTAIMDADFTGPSIPKMFGLNDRARVVGEHILPAETQNGIKVMSVNLLLEDPEQPVVWRGPVFGSAIKQFWGDVVWGDIDYMFIDMPPGTGDVPLTVYQSLPLDGIIVVTSPQDLVSLIVKKACNMAQMMQVPVLGLVENMSYALCPDCGKHLHIFGQSKIGELANELGVLLLGQVPIDPQVTELCNNGEFHKFNCESLLGAADLLGTLR